MKTTRFLPAFLLCATAGPSLAADFQAADYKKALWMSTRYYGAQRSGVGPNWLLMDHTYKTSFVKDADGTRDLEGGWFDCGDHVLFGQTFFYSAYMLARAYDAFPTGFDDHYDGKNYADYKAKGDWSMAGGSPNGIPDLLEELKYATDWMIKATPDGNTFYSQKGDGDLDHKKWVTAGKMSTLPKSDGGEADGPRSFVKNPTDGSMPAFAAATLAVMARRYRKYDAAYADLCLAHAKNAYTYAAGKKGQTSSSGSYYPANANPTAAFVVAAAEMYKTTGTSSYQSDASGSTGALKNHYYTLCYNNTDDLGYWAAAALANQSSALNGMKTLVTSYEGRASGEAGLSTQGSDWGFLRYPANQAFAMALYVTAGGTGLSDPTKFIHDQVDYILGSNNAKQSFLVGFCSGCSNEPKHPHHRNIFLNDNNPTDAEKQAMVIPARNKFFGGIVGGTKTSAAYPAADIVTGYQYTEGGIDYNAGLVGALGYMVSKLAPVDTSKFGTSSSVRARRASDLDLRIARSGDAVLFSAPREVSSLEVLSADGRSVWRSSLEGGSATWSAPSARGVYLAIARGANGTTSSFRFVRD